MYHCHIEFYCIGSQHDIYEEFQRMPPLALFTHDFTVTDTPEPALNAAADVILADVRGMDAGPVLQTLVSGKRESADLILLAGAEQVQELDLAPVRDVWIMPASDGELRFRFLRLQENLRQRCELWQANQFLETTINSSPNLIWYKTKQGIHEKVNDSFCRKSGRPREEIEGCVHVWGVRDADTACAFSDRQVIETKQTCFTEETIDTTEGPRLLATYKSPLFDWNGSVMGTVGVALDITQERAYEQDLLKKNETLEFLFKTMECGVICHTMDGSRILSINDAALRLLDFASQEELEAGGFDTITASVVEEDQPKLLDCIQSLRRANESAATEYRVRHRDGSVLHIIGNIKLVESNGEWFYQRFLLDCTGQKLREQEKQSIMDRKISYQEQLFNIFSTYLAHSTDDVYMMLDAGANHAEYVSPNVERVLGIPVQEIETDFSRISRAWHMTENLRNDLLAMQPGGALPVLETERVNEKTGERRWFRESIYCASLQGEKKIIIYISDRTQERQDQADLLRALDMAEEASKAKSAFLSSVSHDIRTPMNAIMGFLALLREASDKPDRVLEYTQRIDAASQHLLGLINNVLDMNKIAGGGTALNLTELYLAELIDEINTIIRPQAKEKNQTFEIRTSAITCEHLVGDKLRINQILINILSNAVKYTQRGGTVSMTVRELPHAVEGYSRIQFVVRDNGQGMSEAYQKVLFAPFTREQDTLTNQIQGTGLGMSITKELVELMNGTIQVESRLGKGSTFTVELELRARKQEADPKFWKAHGLRRMMVVDRDESVCREIVRLMTGTGVRVEYAADGRTAAGRICSAKDEPYDLVLLDWNMPGSMETARLIRDRCPGKPPLIISTGWDWPDSKNGAQKAGISHFLPKPFFLSNFREAVERLMRPAKKVPVSTGSSALEGKRVLVVDDIEVNRIIMVKILGTSGALCETAENGKEAVEKFSASKPGYYDLIMMDIQMPVMDGYSAARAIRASGHPSAKRVAVIAMTANAFVDDVRTALDAGMDAHIAKPIMVDKMTAIIKDVLAAKDKDER
ncbi:MAG: response regulator [Oscillospiraceae bacterium]|nr:response regulator [Oscillospiraceae bacterium]